MRTNKLIAMISAAVAVSTFATIAEARCTRLAFSVNDYGKKGPADDAKKLLDVYAAKWAAERGIKQHTVGKKEVTCELFIDLVLFDEYTCKAAATVCWPGNEDYASRAPIPGTTAPVKAEASKAVVKTKAAAKPAAITTGSIPAPATAVKTAPATVTAPAPAAPAAPVPAPTAAPADAPKPQ